MKRILTIAALCMLISACRFGSISLQGYVEAEPIWINTPVAGQLQQLHVEAGDAVRAGEMIYRLQDPLLISDLHSRQAELARAKAILRDSEQGQRETILEGLTAQIDQAQAAYDLAVIQYERAVALHKQDAITDAAYDEAVQNKLRLTAVLAEAQANYAEAERGARDHIILANQEAVRMRESQLERVSSQLTMLEVAAPTNGYILDTYYNIGEWINPSQPVVSMVDPAQYVVQFYLPIDLLPEAHLGRDIRFTTHGTDTEYHATISFVSPEAVYTPPMVYADDNTSKFVYMVKATLDPELAPGFRLGQPVTILWK